MTVNTYANLGQIRSIREQQTSDFDESATFLIHVMFTDVTILLL